MSRHRILAWSGDALLLGFFAVASLYVLFTQTIERLPATGSSNDGSFAVGLIAGIGLVHLVDSVPRALMARYLLGRYEDREANAILLGPTTNWDVLAIALAGPATAMVALVASPWIAAPMTGIGPVIAAMIFQVGCLAVVLQLLPFRTHPTVGTYAFQAARRQLLGVRGTACR